MPFDWQMLGYMINTTTTKPYPPGEVGHIERTTPLNTVTLQQKTTIKKQHNYSKNNDSKLLFTFLPNFQAIINNRWYNLIT